jgi:fructoselysine-6-P-deglycase FrlB-like protein
MSAVWNEALTNEEAAEFSPEGMNATEFRHGPLELVGRAQIQRIDLHWLACHFCS